MEDFFKGLFGDPVAAEQRFQEEHQRVQREGPWFGLLKIQRKQTPVGIVCTREEYLCVRCCKSEVFSLSKKELEAVVQGGEDASLGDLVVDAKAHAKGWLTNSYIYPKNPHGVYIVCPECIAADLEAHKRFAKFYGGIE